MVTNNKAIGINQDIASIYEEVMWLANRSKITPSMARAWYTHVRAERLKNTIRMFTGSVSVNAVEDTETDLRLEHFLRIQTTLTQLVSKHVENNLNDPEDFIKTILKCEKVHIVTISENYAAMKAEGNYDIAGIKLIEWENIDINRRIFLWEKMLRGKVANSNYFKERNA